MLAFHPIIQALSEDIIADEQGILLEAAKFDHWGSQLKSLDQELQKEVVANMLVLAGKLQLQYAEAADRLIVQFAELASITLKSHNATIAMFDKAGIDLKQAAKTIGADNSKKYNDDAHASKQQTSLLQLLIAEKQKGPK